MARPTIKKSDVRNIPVVTMCSESEISKHKDKTELAKKFRAIRDCEGTCEACTCFNQTT